MAHSTCESNVCMAGELCDNLLTRAIPEHLLQMAKSCRKTLLFYFKTVYDIKVICHTHEINEEISLTLALWQLH